MKRAGLAIAAAIIAFTPSIASANHRKAHRAQPHIETNCTHVHDIYQGRSGPKIYAQGSNGLTNTCGAAWGQTSMKVATRKALRICARHGSGCRVIAASGGRLHR